MWHCDLVNDHIFEELAYLEELNQIFQTILPFHRIFFILPCIRMLFLVFMCLVVEQFDLSDLFFLRFDEDLGGFNEFMALWKNLLNFTEVESFNRFQLGI